MIGRKNWLFSQTANGAHASSVLYSIIETAKANGLVPFDYLMYVLAQIGQYDVDIDALLSWEIECHQELRKTTTIKKIEY